MSASRLNNFCWCYKHPTGDVSEVKNLCSDKETGDTGLRHRSMGHRDPCFRCNYVLPLLLLFNKNCKEELHAM